MRTRKRTVVVTGASAGVGRATARAFAENGADIALIARESDRLSDATKEIESLGRKALAIPADVADAEAIESAAESVQQQSEDLLEADRSDNLWKSVKTSLGIHGEFGDRAHNRTLQWRWTTNRRWAAPTLILGAFLARRRLW